MIRSIYIRDPLDSYYNSKKLEVNSELEEVLSKIKMILTTDKGSVLGEYDFGVSFDDYLFESTVNTAGIRNEIQSLITKYVPESSKYNINVDVKVNVMGEVYVCYIDIYLNGSKMMSFLV